jgi:hypothetical protein
VDQWISEAEPVRSDSLFDSIRDAIPVFVNFALNNEERIMRELRAALQRRERERAIVRRSAQIALCDELKDDLTALQLSCGVALRETGCGRSKKLPITSTHGWRRTTKVWPRARRLRLASVPQ